MNKNIKPCMGILGFLGFLGFSSFMLDEPVYFLFFSFFSFFSFFWWGKLRNEIEDERMIENHFKAYNVSQRVGFGIIFIGAILINIFLKNMDIESRYGILLMFIAIGFSVTNVMTAFLTYRYETN